MKNCVTETNKQQAGRQAGRQANTAANNSQYQQEHNTTESLKTQAVVVGFWIGQINNPSKSTCY